MIPSKSVSRRLALATAAVVALGACTLALARPANSYAVRVLVSDGNIAAEHVDPDLVNAWGIAFNPVGFSWVSDNGTGKSTLYDGNGVKQSLVVEIPASDGVSTGTPTGIMFSGSATDFKVTENGFSAPARFIFSSEDGVISGWAPSVDQTHAIAAVNRPDSLYKGLAIMTTASGGRLYATDFHNNHVDVFDANFQMISVPGGFVDPKLPPKFAPFGIAAVGDVLYVTYTRQDAEQHDDVAGRGIIDVFDTDGNLLRRGTAQTGLDSPWGVVMAPADFGHFANRLLVSNFGSGEISAYDPVSGQLVGYIRNTDGTRLRVPGLWGIEFGNGLFDQPKNTLFFSGGPSHEAHGVYGRVDPTQ